MGDWGDEVKPRDLHTGVSGYHEILKSARSGKVREVIDQLQNHRELLGLVSLGHNRSFAWEAARGGHAELVEFLIAAKAPLAVPGRIRAQIEVLLPPLCIAIRYKKHEVVELLKNAGQSLDIYSQCYLGHVDDVASVIESKPKLVNEEAEHDSVWRVTLMHYAVTGGHLDMVHLLGQHGAEIARYSRLLLDIASRKQCPGILNALRKYGIDEEMIEKWY